MPEDLFPAGDGEQSERRAAPNESAIPSTLKDLPRWVVWRTERRAGKLAKVPYGVFTRKCASSTDEATWADFDLALIVGRRYNGIGIVLGDGLSGVDLDECRDPETGQTESWAQDIIDALNSYTEVSPSGTGVKIFCLGSLPPGGRRKGNIEMYDSGRYFTVTGQHLPGTPKTVEERTEALAVLHKQTFPPPTTQSTAEASSPNLSDDDLLERMFAAKNGLAVKQLWDGQWQGNYSSQSEADQALCSHLAFWCGGDRAQIERLFTQSGLVRKKWERADYRQRTIDTALAGRTEFYEPDSKQRLPAQVEAAIRTMKPQFHYTDTGNAERLVAAYGRDICYCGLWKKWLRWTGKVWEIDVEKAHVMRIGKQVAWEMYQEAWQIADEKEKKALSKWSIASETISHRTAVVTLAQSEPGIGRDPLVFDTQPWLFNCENGTIDLHTGIKREHRREDHLTKLSPVAFDPAALCPEWDKFLLDIFEGDVELVKYVQYAAGYSLTGDVRADDIFFLHGEGANGKTTLLLTLQEILGPYAIQVPPELLLKRGYRGHTTELMDLFGVRFTASVEVSEGRRFDETRLKQLSGGDRIRGRRIYENDWEFKPTHKLWLAANQKPGVDSDDYAFWRRIKLIPFGVRFTPSGEPGPDINESLRESLFADERPGILNWAVQGCLGWQANGIPAPKAVKAATAEYREEEDVVGQFVESECIVQADKKANPTALYKAFVRWAKDTGATKLSSTAFGRRLTDKGFKSGTVREGGSSNRWRQGIGLRIQPDLDLQK